MGTAIDYITPIFPNDKAGNNSPGGGVLFLRYTLINAWFKRANIYNSPIVLHIFYWGDFGTSNALTEYN